MKNTLLSAENITKSFTSGNSKLEVLKGASFGIGYGEMAVLTGASGSGKSTLLNILAGTDHLDSGKVFLEENEISGYDDSRMAEKRNHDIGFVFQFHHLLGDFTVLENVMIPAMIAGTDSNTIRKKALELTDYLGLSGRISHKPAEISGGEAQRAAVARALINDPKLLLADEPTGNLDRLNGKILLGLLDKINKERNLTILIATHNKELLTGSRRLVLMDGRVSEN
jgi:lipoprotein-releasing system ATP-binding protein